MDHKYCAVCKMNFKTLKNFQIHLETKRHIDRDKTETDMFVCNCGKSYTQRQNMYRHRKTCNKGILAVDPCIIANARIKMLEKQIEDLILAQTDNHCKQCTQEYTLFKVSTKRRNIKKEVRQNIVDKQEKTCGECKKELTPYFQIDHIIGLQFGGSNEESNLMALCCECHAIKSITENQCRKQIQDAILTILREKNKINSK